MARGPVSSVRITSRRSPPPLTAEERTRHPAGGDDRTRTDDPLLAKQVLYQLSYVPGLRARGPLHLESIGRLPADASTEQHAIATATHALVPAERCRSADASRRLDRT